jgi:nucleotide-binding universal stress UspA family protein
MSSFQLRRVLFPTDFSSNSQSALEVACALAGQFQAELHILHVLQDVVFQGVPDPTGVYGLPANYDDRVRESAERALTELPGPSRTDAARVVRALRKGSPFTEIVQYARETGIDLIVMGTHGRSGISHMLLGSVAEKVVRAAECPVMTVRPKDHKSSSP